VRASQLSRRAGLRRTESAVGRVLEEGALGQRLELFAEGSPAAAARRRHARAPLPHVHQLKRSDEARRTLRRLRDVRPNDPQFDLYELDLRDIRKLDDIDRMLSEIRKILNKYPGDMRVEERALGMVVNVIPLMGRMSDQFTDQVNKIVDQMRRLPSYQINWPPSARSCAIWKKSS